MVTELNRLLQLLSLDNRFRSRRAGPGPSRFPNKDNSSRSMFSKFGELAASPTIQRRVYCGMEVTTSPYRKANPSLKNTRGEGQILWPEFSLAHIRLEEFPKLASKFKQDISCAYLGCGMCSKRLIMRWWEMVKTERSVSWEDLGHWGHGLSWITTSVSWYFLSPDSPATNRALLFY